MPRQRLDTKASRTVFWLLLGTALVLPWGTGAAVKIWLDARGLPTYPWFYYLNPWTLGVFVLPSSLYWSSPLLALAFAWRRTARSDRWLGTTAGERLLVVGCGFAFGAGGAVRLYIALFRDMGGSAVPVGLLPFLYLPHVLLGLFLGSAVAGARARRRRSGRIQA